MEAIRNCRLCPRQCGADRKTRPGMCGGMDSVKIARAALHFWEEPCISGARGAGAVFFSGCPLGCCFCQNYPISIEGRGKEVSVGRLAEIFLELQQQGAHNLNLVSAGHYAPWIKEALHQVKSDLHIPVVYNSSGYERVETLQSLEGDVDIYLPDLKFFDSARAARYANAPDYFFVASKAILEMFRQTGPICYDQDGMLKRGVLVRHLVLPKGRQDSKDALCWLAQHLPAQEIAVSIMSQYTPFYRSAQFPEINRRVSTFEYNDVLHFAESLGLDGYMQEKSAAKEEYTPPFDFTGV